MQCMKCVLSLGLKVFSFISSIYTSLNGMILYDCARQFHIIRGVVPDCSLDSLWGGLPGCHQGLACRLASLRTTTGKASRRVKGLHAAMHFFEMSLLSPQSALLKRPLRVLMLCRMRSASEGP